MSNKTGYRMIYLAPSARDQTKLKKLLPNNSYSDGWGGYHVTLAHRIKANSSISASDLIDQLNQLGNKKWVIARRTIEVSQSKGGLVMLFFDSSTLDHAADFLKHQGWKNVGKDWHLTLGYSQEFNFDEKIIEKVCNILKNAKWEWVAVKCDSMKFPPQKIEWYYRRTARDVPSQTGGAIFGGAQPKVGRRRIFLAPSTQDQQKLKQLLPTNTLIDLWKGYHVTVGRSQPAGNVSASQIIDQLGLTNQKSWVIGQRNLVLLSNQGGVEEGSSHQIYTLNFQSSSLDRAADFMQSQGWNSVNRNDWHMTLGYVSELNNQNFNVNKIINILKNARWNWVAVKSGFGGQNTSWYHTVTARDVPSGFGNVGKINKSNLPVFGIPTAPGISCIQNQNKMAICKDGSNRGYDCYGQLNQGGKLPGNYQTYSCPGNDQTCAQGSVSKLNYLCKTNDFSKLDQSLAVFPEYQGILSKINNHQDVRGSFAKLLFVHSTQIPTFLKMMIGDYDQYIRCCTAPQIPYARGAQFRYGLDSMYGDIKIILKPRFWEKIARGVSFDGKLLDHPNFLDIWGSNKTKGDISQNTFIKYLLVSEALNYNFRDLDIQAEPNVKLYSHPGTCQQRYVDLFIDHYKKQLDPPITDDRTPSWCNIQLHLGENIKFTDVLAVIIPKFVLQKNQLLLTKTNGTKVDIADIFNKIINQPKLDGKINPLYQKIIVSNIPLNKYYNNIHYSGKLDDFYKQSGFTSLNFPKARGMKRSGGGSSPLESSPYAMRTEEKIYLKLLLHAGYFKDPSIKIKYQDIVKYWPTGNTDTGPGFGAATVPTSSKVKVLTYNISFESMIGKSNWKLCNNTNPGIPNNTVCQTNVVKLIDQNGPYDFVAMQEASRWKNLRNQSNVLGQMKSKGFTSVLEDCATFWDGNKYQLTQAQIETNFKDLRKNNSNLINSGWSSNSGAGYGDRPIMILIFDQQKTIFINVHLPHSDQNVLLNLLAKVYLKKYAHYRIIIAGDFNKNFSNSKLKLDGRIYHVGNRHIDTCCDTRAKKTWHAGPYDHILDTNAPVNNISSPSVNFPASDHKPILGLLN